ncbi:alpha/beta hydrolase [Aurantibacter sp.]|uniref:alpha/beta fold hydrolase n=1 Tax=Aurantibacter sp. TaxID=2807103 RepID=UPI0032657C3C
MLNYTIYRHNTADTWVTFVHGAGGSSSVWFKQLRAFKQHFNVLLLDLRGHGESKPDFDDTIIDAYTFDSLTNDIIEVIDFEKIEKSHFVGISLGTILIRNIAEKFPDRVQSMVLGGAVMNLNFRWKILMGVGKTFKSVVPHLWLYRMFFFAIMPYSNHKESRSILIKEAQKLYQNEFLRWFKLSSEVNPLLSFFRNKEVKIPTLYVMGGEDYLFLPAVKKLVQKSASASLLLIEHCGHVVNVEESQIFNNMVIGYVSDSH